MSKKNTPSPSIPPIVPVDKCGIQECHGLDLTCGPNVPDACTEIFMVGDVCRSFFRCGIVDGACQQISDPQFETCKTCVQTCESQSGTADPEKVFTCSSKCAENLQK